MLTFSESDRRAIAAAVKAAEGATSGEIVPFVAVRSDRYDIALYRAGLLGGLVGMAGILVAAFLADGWNTSWLWSGTAAAVSTLLAGGFGWIVAYAVPSVRRKLAGDELMAQAVHRRAMAAFVEEEVFNTRDRTGILLFVSVFEHRIEVLGDAGINAKVSVNDWADVIDLVRTGVKRKQIAEGLVAGIHKCGELLESKGVAIEPDDENELRDGLRLDSD